ncbi:uncharacterized protein LOC143276254 isoform X2 [Babylonia areolata]
METQAEATPATLSTLPSMATSTPGGRWTWAGCSQCTTSLCDHAPTAVPFHHHCGRKAVCIDNINPLVHQKEESDVFFHHEWTGITRKGKSSESNEDRSLDVCEMKIWDCAAGWYGEQCNTACSTGCRDRCDRQTVCCLECKTGFYGSFCNISCQYQCLNNECIRDTGLCEACPGDQGNTCSECKPRFYGPSCNTPCQHQCLNNECIRDTGLCEACPECKPRFYGDSCNTSCQYQCLNNECIRDTVLCEACPGNYQGNTCSECPNGYYGEGRNLTCGHCQNISECRHDTGQCTGQCAEGFTGSHCAEAVTDNTPVLVGVVVSALVLILVIVVVIIVVFVKR